MNFQNLKNVEGPQFYLDLAFHRASRQTSELRGKLKGGGASSLQKARTFEFERVNIVYMTLRESFREILKGFPRLESLDPFYLELVKCTIDYDQVKLSLGGVTWFIQQLDKIYIESKIKIKSCKDIGTISRYRIEFYGRISSFVKQIKDRLEYLEVARKKMKEFPPVKTSIPTIVIAGFPNVGKTTLLRALTGSEPKIADYPFTTQKLMIGYNIDKTLQFIDTPGLLDRPLQKRNKIELQAILALKYLAKVIFFVFDPTETCGYTWEEQKNLLSDIQKNFDAEIQIVFNKTDIAEKEIVEKRKKEFDNVVVISAEKNTGTDELNKIVEKFIEIEVKEKEMDEVE
ncbi:MAG: GTPase [Nanoarchaeota archaeon]